MKGREAGKEDSEGGTDVRTVDRRRVGWSGGERGREDGVGG